MIVKDFSNFLDEKGEIPLVERVRGTFQYGSTWHGDIQAQELIIERLQNALDDEFIILRNLTLPGLEVPIPLTLAGPPGLQVIYASSVKGIYQAKGEQWLVMNSNSRRFRSAKPNLITRALLLAQAISRHLALNEFASVPIEPVNIFTDPGIHVDTKSPASRIVMIDALDRYAASIPQSGNTTSVQDVQKIVDLLINPPSPHPEANLQGPDDEMRFQAAFERPRRSIPSDSTEVEVPGLGAVRFKNRQWLVLGALVAVNLLVLAGFVLLTFFYS